MRLRVECKAVSLTGERAILKLGSDKLRNYVQMSLALLARRSWGEFHLRHWTGKTAFLATFRRSLFSGMGCIFDLIERSRSGDVAPTVAAADEILTLVCQSPLSQTNLRAILSSEISCTDASPSGGGSGTATRFVDEAPGVPEKLAFEGRCGHCAGPLDRASIPGYDCPNECGAVACCVDCFAAHRHSCGREMMGKACFGERFCGPNCPLTKAVALEGIFVQPPLDRLRDGNWDFFSPSGRECLEGMEDDGHLSVCLALGPGMQNILGGQGETDLDHFRSLCARTARSEEQRQTLGISPSFKGQSDQGKTRERYGPPINPGSQGSSPAGAFWLAGTSLVLSPMVYPGGRGAVWTPGSFCDMLQCMLLWRQSSEVDSTGSQHPRSPPTASQAGLPWAPGSPALWVPRWRWHTDLWHCQWSRISVAVVSGLCASLEGAAEDADPISSPWARGWRERYHVSLALIYKRISKPATGIGSGPHNHGSDGGHDKRTRKGASQNDASARVPAGNWHQADVDSRIGKPKCHEPLPGFQMGLEGPLIFCMAPRATHQCAWSLCLLGRIPAKDKTSPPAGDPLFQRDRLAGYVSLPEQGEKQFPQVEPLVTAGERAEPDGRCPAGPLVDH